MIPNTPASSSIPPLPSGWTAARDPVSGRTYYANATTGESSWTPPDVLPPPPSTVFQQQLQQPAAAAVFQAATPTSQQQPHSSVAALAQGGLLVPAARALVDAQTVGTNNADLPPLELQPDTGLSVGQIADLCTIQQEEFAATVTDDDDARVMEPYTPIHPYGLGIAAKRTPMEAGRLDIRIHALYDKLQKLPQPKPQS